MRSYRSANTEDQDMPCRVDPTPEETVEARRLEHEAWASPLRAEISSLREDLRAREAMLCAVFSLLENGFDSHGITFYLEAVLDRIDWREAGVTRYDTEAWWEDHKDRDAERRHQEALALERRRQEILARLSDEEREILGV